MTSGLGQAAQGGAGALRMTAEALKGPADVIAAELGGQALGKVMGASAKPLQGAIDEAVAAGGKRSQPINLKGQFRVETHPESVPRSVQQKLGVKIQGTIQKPWHLSIMGHDIPLNPFNPLWKLFK